MPEPAERNTCDHDYQVTQWGFPCVTYTCRKCGDEYERDVS